MANTNLHRLIQMFLNILGNLHAARSHLCSVYNPRVGVPHSCREFYFNSWFECQWARESGPSAGRRKRKEGKRERWKRRGDCTALFWGIQFLEPSDCTPFTNYQLQPQLTFCIRCLRSLRGSTCVFVRCDWTGRREYALLLAVESKLSLPEHKLISYQLTGPSSHLYLCLQLWAWERERRTIDIWA